MARATARPSWQGPGDVWAPRAARVDLVVDDQLPVALSPTGDGWFRPEEPLAPATRYRFSIDGGGPLADPRSARQPDGVHGPSEVVDHEHHPWTDGRWPGFDLDRAVLYELHVGTFADGSFAGVVDRLPELVALGVDALELMPVASFDGEHGWGYDGVFLYAVHEPYGGPDGLKALVDAAHAAGLGIVLDVVYNHLGPTGNVLTSFGPYLTDRHRTPWGDAVNFDGREAHEVRRFVLDNARYWFDRFHVDGLRLDATHAIVDHSPVPILRQLAEEASEWSARDGRKAWLIAEHEAIDERLVMAPEAGGAGLDAVWDDPVHHAVHALLTGERDGYYRSWGTVGDVARVLVRHCTRDDAAGAGSVRPDRFVTFDQNHDQVGNRASGERLHHLVGTELGRVAAALVLLGPGVPMLFMGEEWSASTAFPYFCGERSRPLDEAVRRGRLEELAAFGWTWVPDPVSPATMECARLRWDERAEPPHADSLDWYRRLIDLRRTRPELSSAAPAASAYDEEARWVRLCRSGLVVAANLGENEVVVPLPRVPSGTAREVLLASTPVGLDTQAVRLPPRSAAVVGPP